MKIFIALCLFIILTGCKKTDHLSECIQTKVDEFRTSNPCTNGTSVKEYKFKGKWMYVFVDGSCVSDGGAAVWDDNCNYLGYLGGFVANTKINGVDFYSNAEYKRTIWSN